MSSPKIRQANREQVEMHLQSLDQLLDPDHKARIVWSYVERMDLSPVYAKIKSVKGGDGAPATDPKIMMALWLMAMLDGVGSARRLEQLAEEHIAYKWICGGVPVNYHTLSDFRTAHVGELERLLAEGVAAMIHSGLVKIEDVAIDGMRVRASAGTSSFRRAETIEEQLTQAKSRVAMLMNECEGDAAACSKRERAARERAARERLERLEAAKIEVEKVREGQCNKSEKEPRASTTDPQARNTKMANSGYNPAYNIEFASDTSTKVILGVQVINSTDFNQMTPMLDGIYEHHRAYPTRVLADGGFAARDDLQAIHHAPYNAIAIVPPRGHKKKDYDAYSPKIKDTKTLIEWRARMATEEAKELYKLRGATAELVNAQVRNRGLQRFTVRGLVKAKAVALFHAIAHNIMRSCALMKTPMQQAA